MSLQLLIGASLVFAQAHDPLDRGRDIGAWSFALHVCGLAGYSVHTEPVEDALADFESGLVAQGLSRGDGARAFDEGMELEIKAFDVSGWTASGEEGLQVIKAAASRIKERCRLVAEALPGSIVETDNAETRVEAIVATWYGAAHE